MGVVPAAMAALKSADDYYREGVRLFQAGDRKEAVILFDKALKIDPNHRPSLTMRDANDADEAVQRFDRASVAPDADDQTKQQLYNYKGIVLHSKKDYDGAIASYDKALKLDPEFAEAHCNKGSALDDRGDAEAAIRCFKRALELDDRSETHYNIGIAYYNHTESEPQAKKRNYDSAIMHLEQAISMNDQFKEALTALGNAVYHKAMQPGRTQDEKKELLHKAVEKYNSSLDIDRRQKETHVALGNTHRQLNDYDRAIRQFDEAISIDGKYIAAWACRGNCYYKRSQHQGWAKQGDAEAAVDSFDEALRLDPNNEKFKENREIAKGSSGCGCATCVLM